MVEERTCRSGLSTAEFGTKQTFGVPSNWDAEEGRLGGLSYARFAGPSIPFWRASICSEIRSIVQSASSAMSVERPERFTRSIISSWLATWLSA